MGQLKFNGFDVSHESYDEISDVVIVNTCGFIEEAKEESINAILEMAEMKKAGRIKKLFVIGCLSQRYKQQLEKEIPGVDRFFGVYQIPEILKTLGSDYKSELLGERLISTPSHYAYLKISEGCNRKCSFCAIPLIKGKHKSVPEIDLLKETEKLCSAGVKELILISQDLTYYGLDLKNKRTLPELVEKLANFKELEWLRLHYAYPADFPLKLLRVIKDNNKICRYLDIPFQHANDRILKSMRRGINLKQTEELINRIREMIPGVALRTSFIVGYPGETEKEFNDLVRFIMKYRFERVGVFTYSHEEDTYAYSLGNDVPEDTKIRRAEELMRIQEGISYELNQDRIGNIYKVLIDRDEGYHYIGRTEYDSPEVDNEVILNKDELSMPLKTGEFYDVRITGADSYEVSGTLADKMNK